MSTPSSVSAVLLAAVPFGARGRSRRPPSVAGVVVGVGVGPGLLAVGSTVGSFARRSSVGCVGTGVVPPDVVPPDVGTTVRPGVIRYCEAAHTLSCCSLQSSDRARTAASDAQKSHQRAISVTA